MLLTLLVPGLLLPDEVRTATAFDLTAPALSLLLGRATRRELAADWLAGTFALPAPLPVAALRQVGLAAANPHGTGGTASAVSGHWLCLDPVHLRVTREGVTLADPAALALTDNEAAALVAAVAPLFADLGTLSNSAPDQWEIQLKAPVALDTQPLPAAIGHAVSPRLPGGAEGQAWRRLLAEAQTVLHAHPVNRQRENQGQPTVNSLWPWGGGALDGAATADWDVVWAFDPVLQGLCTLAALPCLMAPQRFQPASGRVLALLEDLARPARELDALAWREGLLGLETRWFAPVLAALRRGDCTQVQLVGSAADGRTVCHELSRRALWRFWRRPQPLTGLS